MSTLGQKLKHEITELIPVTVFFFVSFQTQALMLEEYGIHVTTFLTATFMAMIVAKVVVLTDHFALVNRFPDKPLIYSVAWKTAIYFMASLRVRYVEHLIHTLDFPMKATSNPHRRPAGLFPVGLCLLLAAASVGCSSKPVWKPEQRPDRQVRLTRGCIFYMDGAGGGTAKSNYAAGVVSGMLDAGYKGAGELVAWETGKGLMADQKASVEYKREKAKDAADKIENYREDYPHAPVGLLGFSAGTAEVVFALESLPEDTHVHHVVLLGTSISRDYDMTKALKRVKHKLHIITSPHDHMLSVLMPFSGTADRKYHDPGAGIKGFVLPPNASAETRQLYAEKIVVIPYSKDWRKDGDDGHHFDNVKEDFIRDHIAPLLMAQADSSP